MLKNLQGWEREHSEIESLKYCINKFYSILNSNENIEKKLDFVIIDKKELKEKIEDNIQKIKEETKKETVNQIKKDFMNNVGGILHASNTSFNSKYIKIRNSFT